MTPHDRQPDDLLSALGGEEGCRRLSSEFYSRVAKDPVLKRLFPGKSLRCATEEFAAWLIQFLDGDEEQTQKRWWLSLSESHSRFRIRPEERAAWLRNMEQALAAIALDAAPRAAWRQFFHRTSQYVTGSPAEDPGNAELAQQWSRQKLLDRTVAAIAAGDDATALDLAPHFAHRRAIFTGLLARMLATGRPSLIRFVTDALAADPPLATARYGSRTFLHYASGAGCLDVVEALLRAGLDPNITDRGEHTPLYSVANECASPAGPAIVRALISAGAYVNACEGVTRATPLHMAARRGHVEIARALLDCGADVNARDRRGDTPLQRARNCRQSAMAALLARVD